MYFTNQKAELLEILNLNLKYLRVNNGPAHVQILDKTHNNPPSNFIKYANVEIV